jgi:hypothetical protein
MRTRFGLPVRFPAILRSIIFCRTPLGAVFLGALVVSVSSASAQSPAWFGYGGNAQHTALAPAPADPLSRIAWSTPVDLDPQHAGGQPDGDLFIHYGSPMITAANTVIVPVKTGALGGFQIEGINGANGATLWTQSSDYQLPTHNWTPSYSPTLTPDNRLFYSGANGTLNYISNINSTNPTAPVSMQFYSPGDTPGTVFINTPLTSDSHGDIFFGYQVSGGTTSSPLGTGGIGALYRNANGTYTPSYVTAAAATNNSSSIGKVVQNCAPAVSPDGSTVYVAVNSQNVGFSSGYLLALNASNLSTIAKVQPIDPQFGSASLMPDDGTASPTIGPDGHVYFGVFDAANTSRGWMMQYNLTTNGSGTSLAPSTPGGFGWDDTVSIVPASMVPSYHGTSTYLLMTKYNNYIDSGSPADGQNRLAILDPNATMVDNQRANPTGATIMQTVLTVLGPTPNPKGGVDEWCINNAVVDPATDSILVNSEDGHLYRWDLTTNTLSQSITLTGGIGEAYTPTVVGPNGAVYAINDAVLYSVVPEPSTIALAALCGAALLFAVRRRR